MTHPLFKELIHLTRDWNAHDDVPEAQKIECRKIGEKLNEAGGMDLMVQAYYAAKAANRYVAVIQAYWDGIGPWRW